MLQHEGTNGPDQEVKAEQNCGKIKTQTEDRITVFLVLEAFLFSAN